MKSGRLIVAKGQEFAIREYDVPAPAADAVVIKQEMAGICGTDIHPNTRGVIRQNSAINRSTPNNIRLMLKVVPGIFSNL